MQNSSRLKQIISYLMVMCCLVISSQSWGQTLEKVSIQLNWFHQFQFAGYYAAKEQGFYQELGFEVELREFNGKGAIEDYVLDGRSQYGINDSSLIVAKSKGKPVVIVAQIFQHSPATLATLRSSGISTPFDLIGKRILADSVSESNAPIIAMLKQAGVDMSEYTWQEESYQFSALEQGDTDAVLIYNTDEPFKFNEEDVDIFIIDPRDYGIDFYGDNLFTSEAEVKNHPQRAQAIRQATIKGWKYALSHQSEMIEMIFKKYNSQKKSIAHLTFEANEINKIILAKFIPIGSMTTTRMEKTAEIYHQLGMIDSPFLPENILLDQALESFSPETVAADNSMTLIIAMVAISLLLIAITLLLPKLITAKRLAVFMASRKFPLIVHSISALNVVIIFSVIYLTLQENEESTQVNMSKNLKFVVEATTTRLSDWIGDQEKLLKQISADDKVVKLTEKLLQQSTLQEKLITSSSLQDIRQYFRQSSIEGQGFFVINRDNINIGSSRNENLGQINLIAQQQPDVLAAVFSGETRFVSPIKSDVNLLLGKANNPIDQYSMFIVTPVIDHNHQVIAALTLRIQASGRISDIMQQGRIGASGESYLINNQGEMLSKSRFDSEISSLKYFRDRNKADKLILLKDPLINMYQSPNADIKPEQLAFTHMANNLLSSASSANPLVATNKKIASNVIGYNDYRGIKVYGAWLWDDNLALALPLKLT
jgi:ABC-type nitrate/sulfonate/bicarbonate transport system substrate-binding protein